MSQQDRDWDRDVAQRHTHGLLESIRDALLTTREDHRTHEHLQRIEMLLQVLVTLDEVRNQKLDTLIGLLSLPETYPQANSAKVTNP